MSTLAELQRGMQSSLLQGIARGDVIERIVASPGADANARLGVYLQAYRARLLEVLGNDYPGLRKLAGADAFEHLALAYIDANPSTHYNVRWYGGALAGFLREAPDASAQPAFAAMAELEWAMGLAFDAAMDRTVDAAAMAAVAPAHWPGMGLRPHPSLQRVAFAWNVPDIRRAVDHDTVPPALCAWQPAQPWMVWRRQSGVRYRRLEDDEAAAFAAIADGASFAQVCELLCAFHPVDAVAARAASLFRGWIEDQWIAELIPGGAG